MTNVPLASIQDEWSEFSNFKTNDKNNINNGSSPFRKHDQLSNEISENELIDKQIINNQTNDDDEEFKAFEQFNGKSDGDDKIKTESLEELVNTFDEKIVNCFVNYEEPVESIVGPVPIMSHEELVNQCQMWFNLIENFNHILPINWSSTYAIKFLLPYLIGENDENSNKSNLDKNNSINNYLDRNLDYSFDSSLETQLDDDQFVLSSFGYDYSTCKLQTSLDDSFANRTNHHFSSYLNEFESEYEEQLARDLDFHSLILCSNGTNESNDGKPLLFTAEEVLKELDIILSEDDHYLESTIHSTTLDKDCSIHIKENDELDVKLSKESTLSSKMCNNKYVLSNLLKPYNRPNSIGTSFSSNSLDEVLSPGQSLSRSQTSSSQISSGIDGGECYSSYTITKNQIETDNEKQLFEKQLRTLNNTQLNEIYLNLERMIQNYSEILISELALKDELQYEKELKNQFISLLICIQNKRRKQNLLKKNNPKSPNSASSNDQGAKYLTTVIPYNSELGAPDTRTLQMLIKILKAINEDSPTVPTLLTDFILKVICPTS